MTTDRHHLDPAQFENRGRRPSVVYAYVDADGAPIGAVARFEAATPPGRKSFSQYRFEDGRYVSGLAGRQLPLYRLDALAPAVQAGATIWIAEGESCVDALVQRGLLATTNAGGAGKWNPEHAEHLRGALVVTLADSDGPGREHAQGVAASLHGIAVSVRVLELPASAEGDDVIDWFERGGTAELLTDLAGTAAQWTPPRTVVEEPWPEPIPFAVQSRPEPFPIDSGLPGELRDLACAIAEVVRIDVTAPAVLLPTAISGAAGNAYSVRVSPSHAEPNLSRLTATVFDSGERKSALFRIATQPFGDWACDGMEEYKRQKRRYDDEIERLDRQRAEQIKKHAKSNFPIEHLADPPREPRFPLGYLTDVTTPELVRRSYHNGGAAFLQSGDSRHLVDLVLGQYRADGQVDDSVFLRAHGGDTIDRARVGGGQGSEYLIIRNPAIALAMAIQPDKVEQLVARRETISSGLLPRINFSWPVSQVGTRFELGDETPLPKDLKDRYAQCIRAVLDARHEIVDKADDGAVKPVELTLDRAAVRLRREFFNELEELIGPGRPLREVQAFVSKCAGEAARLAGLLHLYELAGSQRLAVGYEIPAATWTIAATHQRWQLYETLRVLEISRESELERVGRRLVDWARQKGEPGQQVASRDAIGARRVNSAEEFDAAMAFLQERGWVRRVDPKGREQTPRWVFHPNTHGGDA